MLLMKPTPNMQTLMLGAVRRPRENKIKIHRWFSFGGYPHNRWAWDGVDDFVVASRGAPRWL